MLFGYCPGAPAGRDVQQTVNGLTFHVWRLRVGQLCRSVSSRPTLKGALDGRRVFLRFVALAGTWGDIVQDGVVNSVSGEPEREAALWFFYAGIGFMAIGTFAYRAIHTTGRLPLQVGVYLLLIGGTMAVIQPVSGGILVLIAGAMALAAARLST